MIEFFDWLDEFLTVNGGYIGALCITVLMLAVIGAIAELDA